MIGKERRSPAGVTDPAHAMTDPIALGDDEAELIVDAKLAVGLHRDILFFPGFQNNAQEIFRVGETEDAGF